MLFGPASRRFVLVQSEMTRRRSPVGSIPSFGRSFKAFGVITPTDSWTHSAVRHSFIPWNGLESS